MTKSAKAVVIGASSGGIDALFSILPELPKNYPMPVLTVIHLPPDKESLLSEIFSPRCKLKTCEAEDKQPLEPGTIYFAPPNYHMLVEKDKTLSLSNEDPVVFSRPSIDVLFESAADVYGEELIGVILTGANNDGAEGLKAVASCKGIALVQDPAKSFMSAMPEAALKSCPGARPLQLSEISDFLKKAGEAA